MVIGYLIIWEKEHKSSCREYFQGVGISFTPAGSFNFHLDVFFQSDGKKIESESNVLLASIENMQYAVTFDVLQMVFSAFGLQFYEVDMPLDPYLIEMITNSGAELTRGYQMYYCN
ncbi:hypothetical protein L1987_75935 [Smallanthus sonchifolius]|uniref:Uncharacterized protein n=1 Tax=Smallanthus sonchifolius TaxID=185202 RepID=A0ACB9A6U7_9ASTR|nr:hypothetical protein L1987_75935 [Smallanthus sonchifolius]